ncbi:MAG: serine/threonine-protein kinase [Myxococcales bacterium]|nr:serine/threonine-protein kinase [Myxococcales bacterium]
MKPIPASSAGLAAGLLFDNRYRLEEIIGYGGMGQVWSATHVSTGQNVAIKVLHENILQDEDARVRFDREARVMESLGDMSRHITRVLEYGVLSDGVPYLIMERLKGEGLDLLLKRQKVLPLPQIADIARQLCKALAVTHAEGIIHRDIKPPNVFLCPDPDNPEKIFVKLLDFGIAKVLAETGESTLQGKLIGTPNYMSPEQLTPKVAIDHRADIFAVGAIIYRCATGRVAFGKGTPQEMVHRVLHETPTPATSINPALPPEFDLFLSRCLAKRPEDRFQSMRELIDILDLLVEDPAAARVSLLPRSHDRLSGSQLAFPTPSPTPKSQALTSWISSPLLWVLLALFLLGSTVLVFILRPR